MLFIVNHPDILLYNSAEKTGGQSQPKGSIVSRVYTIWRTTKADLNMGTIFLICVPYNLIPRWSPLQKKRTNRRQERTMVMECCLTGRNFYAISEDVLVCNRTDLFAYRCYFSFGAVRMRLYKQKKDQVSNLTWTRFTSVLTQATLWTTDPHLPFRQTQKSTNSGTQTKINKRDLHFITAQ